MNKINRFKEFTNEQLETSTSFAFDDEIKIELKRYLKDTIWNKVDQIEQRAEKLIDLHMKFIDNVRNKMSANEIAEKLFEYEKNNLKRK